MKKCRIIIITTIQAEEVKICYSLMIIDGEYYLLVGLLKVIICDFESSLISFCQVVGVAYTPQLRGNSNMYDANQTRVTGLPWRFSKFSGSFQWKLSNTSDMAPSRWQTTLHM